MMKLFFILQAEVSDAAELVAQGAGEMKMPFLELAQKGGWIMIPIIFLSFVAVYIFFERFFAVRKASQIDVNFMNRIKDYIYDGKLDAALALCQSFHNLFLYLFTYTKNTPPMVEYF